MEYSGLTVPGVMALGVNGCSVNRGWFLSLGVVSGVVVCMFWWCFSGCGVFWWCFWGCGLCVLVVFVEWWSFSGFQSCVVQMVPDVKASGVKRLLAA